MLAMHMAVFIIASSIICYLYSCSESDDLHDDHGELSLSDHATGVRDLGVKHPRIEPEDECSPGTYDSIFSG